MPKSHNPVVSYQRWYKTGPRLTAYCEDRKAWLFMVQDYWFGSLDRWIQASDDWKERLYWLHEHLRRSDCR